jgi:hypothetical protein
VGQLADACPDGHDVVREMEPWIVEPVPATRDRDPAGLARTVERYSFSSDAYLRAAAAWIAAGSDDSCGRQILDGAGNDPDPLVREVAATAAATGPNAGFARLGTLAKMQFLRSVNLFANLAPEDLHDLVGFVTEETVPPGTAICEEGDVDSDDLFVLLEGRASVVVAVHGESPGEREVAVLDAGEIIGEMSMLDGSARSATVRPKDAPIRVLRVSGQRFRSRLLPRARVARPLLVTLAQRIRNMSH